MCGIAGLYSSKEKLITSEILINRSLKKLANRGPDNCAIKNISNQYGNLFLGHTRLSIIDLSNEANQPMESKDRRYTIVFNGEIYNYIELRNELRDLGHIFNTASDTEVLMKSWEHWQQDCIPRLNGMFAFAIHDKNNNKITIVRDAFGIKPLFYYIDDVKNHFSFSSELPALLDLIDISPKLDKQSTFDYLVGQNYDLNEKTFFENICSLLPGEYISFDLKCTKILSREIWWKPSIIEEKNISFQNATCKIRDKFLNNINLHLRSDLPIGAALSGGIDSSAIVCSIRHLYPDMDIHTFTYVADEKKIDEEIWADKVNNHVGAISHKIKFKPFDIVNDLDDLIKTQGAPFSSTSIYAQFKVFQEIKRANIKVILDGQGADEILAGYDPYIGARIKSLIKKGKFIDAIKLFDNWNKKIVRSKRSSLIVALRPFLSDDYINYFKTYLGKNIYSLVNQRWFSENGVDKLSPERKLNLNKDELDNRYLSSKLLRTITSQGLVHLLRHEDRSSMRWSIESRVPFLTTDFVDFCLSLPEEYIISSSAQSKFIFRQAMRGIVPDEILDRKDKIGFQTPEGEIIKQLLPSFKEFILDNESFPFINSRLMKKIKEDKEISNYQGLWRVINFCKWFKLFQPSL